MTEAWVVGCRGDSLGKGRARGGRQAKQATLSRDRTLKIHSKLF
jgi:hypothetical protein